MSQCLERHCLTLQCVKGMARVSRPPPGSYRAGGQHAPGLPEPHVYQPVCPPALLYLPIQCVKDMARVNRPLGRTVLVDDTPLAFLHQPDNGIPVLGFRGDPDDRLLMEAVLPLLQVRGVKDVAGQAAAGRGLSGG